MGVGMTNIAFELQLLRGALHRPFHAETPNMKEEILMKLSKLLALALVLLIGVGALAGSTIAWFTDTVTSESNIIESGKLDLVVSYKDGDNWKNLEDADAEPLFNYEKWEPGYAVHKTVKLENKGNLAF